MCFLEDLYGGWLLIWVVLLMTVSCFCETAEGMTEAPIIWAFQRNINYSSLRALSRLFCSSITHTQQASLRTALWLCMEKKTESQTNRQTDRLRERQTDRHEDLGFCAPQMASWMETGDEEAVGWGISWSDCIKMFNMSSDFFFFFTIRQWSGQLLFSTLCLPT